MAHLFSIQRDLGFHGEDEVGRGVSELAGVLVDVAVHLQAHVVIYMSVREAGGVSATTN